MFFDDYSAVFVAAGVVAGATVPVAVASGVTVAVGFAVGAGVGVLSAPKEGSMIVASGSRSGT
jgi:hypothetical protein